MKARLVFLLAIALVAVALTCGDSPTGSEGVTYTFADFVHFDTAVYLLKSVKSIGQLHSEPYLWYELTLGEPFTDVNNNGAYDDGIDVFIICDCDSNQDLNHNGIYDGPGGYCEAGLRFDDINGDGICQGWLSHHWSYQPNLPYADLNQNGVYDSTLDYSVAVVKCAPTVDTTGDTSFVYYFHDSAFIFVSDSNLTYFLPGWVLYGKEESYKALQGEFQISDSGLQFYHRLDFTVPVLDSGIITFGYDEVEVLISVWHFPDPVYMTPLIFTKTVSVGQSLVIWDVHYKDLLLVKLVYPPISTDNGTETPPLYFFEFFFSQDRGLVAVFYRSAIMGGYFCFDTQFDSIPLPMTR